MNGSPRVPFRIMNDASVKVHLMTGFRRSERSSDNSKQGKLTCGIVAGPSASVAPQSGVASRIEHSFPSP